MIKVKTFYEIGLEKSVTQATADITNGLLDESGVITTFKPTTIKTQGGTESIFADCGDVSGEYYTEQVDDIVDIATQVVKDTITVKRYSGEATSTLYYGTCDVTRVDLGTVELVVITASNIKCNGTISTGTENTPIFTFPQGALAGLNEKVLLAFCKSTNFAFARFRVYESNNQLSIFYGTTEDGWYNASETFIVPKT